MRASSPGKERGAQELGGILPPRQTCSQTRGPLLIWPGSQREVTRLLCLPSELKVQEVFRNEVTGGTWRFFFFFLFP